MILLLHGKCNFLSLRELKKITSEQKKKGSSLEYVDLKEKHYQNFKSAFFSRSMFSKKKTVVVKNGAGNERFEKKFLKDKERFLASPYLLIFYSRKKLKKTKLLKFLEKNSKTKEFEKLSKGKLRKWIKNEASRYNAELTPSALKALLSLQRKDLWRLSLEINKLANYKGASKEKGATITKKDVDFLIREEVEKDIFKSIDALALKKKKKALTLIKNHLEEGDHPAYLLSMIAWQISRLLVIKEREERGESLKDLGWHPYVVKKSRRISRNFSLKELKSFFHLTADFDLKIKTGRVDPELALELLVAKI